MLAAGALATALTKTPIAQWNQTLYRAVDLEALYGFHQITPYPTIRPLYSLGAPATGARFTPRGGPSSLYMAEDNATALDEATLTLATPNPNLHTPKVVFSAKITLAAFLDLTQLPVQTMLGTSLAELSKSWRLPSSSGSLPATQLLGQAVFDSGRYSAIRFPSTKRANGNCFVIFTDRLSPPSFVEIYDPNGNLKERIP